MNTRHSWLLLVAVCALRTACAQVLTSPPLASDEVVVTTASGCAVVGRWSPERQRRNGLWLQALKSNLSDIRFDRECPPGELITGHPGRRSEWLGDSPPDGMWYYFGRRFGINEASAQDPEVRVAWDGLYARLPVDVGAPESFARRLEAGSVGVAIDDDQMALQVEASVRYEDRKLPKEQRHYELTVQQGEKVRTIACPAPGEPASCWPLWKQHATPAIERAQRLVAECRPKVEARREAVRAHLQALGRQP